MSARYYCVHVSQSGRKSLQWSLAFDRPGEAARHGQRLIDNGKASTSFVVRSDYHGQTVLPKYSRPTAARRVIGHYLDLLAGLDRPAEP